MLNSLRQKGQELRAQLYILYRGLGDPRVGWQIKLLAIVIIAYVVCPLDLIPDFIPVLGLLDELILVPLGIFLVLKLIPADIGQEYLEINEEVTEITDRYKFPGSILVICTWLVMCLIIYRLWPG